MNGLSGVGKGVLVWSLIFFMVSKRELRGRYYLLNFDFLNFFDIELVFGPKTDLIFCLTQSASFPHITKVVTSRFIWFIIVMICWYLRGRGKYGLGIVLRIRLDGLRATAIVQLLEYLSDVWDVRLFIEWQVKVRWLCGFHERSLRQIRNYKRPRIIWQLH
jgi:hypothetical protein